MKDYEFIQLCKALSDENRLKIVKMLMEEEKCGCKLLECFNITQPTLSHHMKILVNCGLVKDRKEGKWHHYSIQKDYLENIKAYVKRELYGNNR